MDVFWNFPVKKATISQWVIVFFVIEESDTDLVLSRRSTSKGVGKQWSSFFWLGLALENFDLNGGL